MYTVDCKMQDSKAATKKRIETLKKAEPGSPGRKPRAGPFKQANAAAEAEARAPKKLSQIKVDPSIAKSLGVPSRGSSPAPSAASAAPSRSQTPTEMLDLLGDSTSEAAAPSAQAPQVTPSCRPIAPSLCVMTVSAAKIRLTRFCKPWKSLGRE